MRRHSLMCAVGYVRPATIPALALVVAACTTITVPPAPIDPMVSARALTARSLQDPIIADALARMGLSAQGEWTLDTLTVVAWTLRSDVAVAEADINMGLAAERVAGL